MSKYFAAAEASKTAATLLDRAERWFNFLFENGYHYKIRKAWEFYHGHYYNSTHEIGQLGEYGEYSALAANHFRNIADLMVSMIINARLTYKARAANTDSKSLIQTELANGLLDYYVRQKRVEKYVHEAVRQAVVLGAGYIKIEWNATLGDIYDYHPDTNAPIYEGDIEIHNLDIQDVLFDPNKGTNEKHNWVLTRSWRNKFDLIAKFPEFEEKIKSLRTKTDYIQFKQGFDVFDKIESDDVAVYEFYHLPTESMPNGRYLMFLSEDVILLDLPMPYRRLPVLRITPSEIMGTPFGSTPLFDLLPLQEAYNSLLSTVYTNQITFGVQNIYVPRGADISLKSLEGGLNIIEGNPGQGKPEALNLTQTPPEIFQSLAFIRKEMETISGMNSVVRGDPESSLKTGAALALVQSMALQYISRLQSQYVMLVEDLGMMIIELLRDFAAVPRIAVIAGESNDLYVKREFNSDDLSTIDRVVVDIGNPVAVTTAGKLQIASELIQYGIIKTPEDYFTVLDTGQLKFMTEDNTRQNNFVKKENEFLLRGQPVTVLMTDAHLYHIRKHKALLDDPEMRDSNSPIVANILNHILDHVNALRETDPGLLGLLQEQPLPPLGGSQPSPEQTAPNINESLPPGTDIQDPTAFTPEMPNLPNLPEGATPPPDFIPPE
ncbi:MAG: hypothetical protein RML94_10195 [Bacteroidia bacterium]|nr:hypothetical protein [Bacteroidia bacterium]